MTPETAPAMAGVRDKGVDSNSHSLFPTFTTANAVGMATGHHLGDTGDFSNTIYAGYPVGAAGDTVRRSSRTMPCSAMRTSISAATISTRRPS